MGALFLKHWWVKVALSSNTVILFCREGVLLLFFFSTQSPKGTSPFLFIHSLLPNKQCPSKTITLGPAYFLVVLWSIPPFFFFFKVFVYLEWAFSFWGWFLSPIGSQLSSSLCSSFWTACFPYKGFWHELKKDHYWNLVFVFLLTDSLMLVVSLTSNNMEGAGYVLFYLLSFLHCIF